MSSCGGPPGFACRTYAPVGSHRDLLAYLVRRLLENGANSSFVALAADNTCRSRNCCGGRPTSSAPPTARATPTFRCRPTSIGRAQEFGGVEFGERAASASS